MNRRMSWAGRLTGVVMLVSTTLFGAIGPVSAMAPTGTATPGRILAGAPRWNRIGFTVHSNATWTSEGVDRHKTSYGNMVLSLSDNMDGGTWVRLRSVHTGLVFAGPVYWAPGTYGDKLVATHVAAGTTFRVEAKKGRSGGTNNQWGGQFYY